MFKVMFKVLFSSSYVKIVLDTLNLIRSAHIKRNSIEKWRKCIVEESDTINIKKIIIKKKKESNQTMIEEAKMIKYTL